MEKLLTMSERELRRVNIMKMLKAKRIKQRRAAEEVGVTERHLRRLLKRYKTMGVEGLISKKRGRASNRKMSDKQKGKIERLITKNYSDYGPTFAAEKLKEKHAINVSNETVRKIMIGMGIWRTKRPKKPTVHQMRNRRASEGELVQIDGSPHHWLEERGELCTLLAAIDDATSKIKMLRFVPVESTEGYFELMRGYLKKHGRPQALYSDKHGIFRINHKGAISGNGMTQFGRGMKELDIKILCANSPQAKGRVERLFQTLQDRLVKELRLEDISDMESANEYLAEYIKIHNKKFSVKAESKDNAHRKVFPATKLDEILTTIETRCLSKNLTFQYDKIIYQIQTDRASYAMRKAQVKVFKDNRGGIRVKYKNKDLRFTTHVRQEKQGEICDTKNIETFLVRKKGKPSKRHPWR